MTKVILIICGICAVLGIVLAIIGMALGFRAGDFRNLVRTGRFSVGSISGGEDVNYQFSKKEVYDLDMEIDYGMVEIVSVSDSDYIQVTGTASKYFNCTLSNGVLKISDGRESVVHIFGWNNNQSHITVYVPADQSFGKIDIELGAGEMITNDLTAEKLDAEVGAGSLYGTNFKISGHTSFDVGAGNIEADGRFDSNVNMNCGVGKITLNAAGVYEDYNYDVNCGIGKITIGHSSHSGLGNEQYIDLRADKTMYLDCGVGKIEVYFKQEDTYHSDSYIEDGESVKEHEKGSKRGE